MADKNTNIKLNLIAEIKNGKAVGRGICGWLSTSRKMGGVKLRA